MDILYLILINYMAFKNYNSQSQDSTSQEKRIIYINSRTKQEKQVIYINSNKKNKKNKNHLHLTPTRRTRKTRSSTSTPEQEQEKQDHLHQLQEQKWEENHLHQLRTRRTWGNIQDASGGFSFYNLIGGGDQNRNPKVNQDEPNIEPKLDSGMNLC